MVINPMWFMVLNLKSKIVEYLNSQTVKSWRLDRLKDQSCFDLVEQTITELDKLSEISALHSLFVVLSAKVDAWPELYDQYEHVLIRLRFMTLPLQIFDDIVVLLKNNLCATFKYNINLYDKITLRFLLKERKVALEEQKKILNALLESKEIIDVNNKQISVGDLLKGYDEYLNKDDSLAHFVEDHKDIFISGKTTELLFSILDIYEWLFFYETGRSSVPRKVQFEGVQNAEESTVDYSAIVDEIVLASNLNLKDELLAQREKNIILSCLKHIRDMVDTKVTLSKPIDLGGLGLGEAVCNTIISIIKQNIGKIEKVVPELAKPDIDYMSLLDRLELMPPVPAIMRAESVFEIVPPVQIQDDQPVKESTSPLDRLELMPPVPAITVIATEEEHVSDIIPPVIPSSSQDAQPEQFITDQPASTEPIQIFVNTDLDDKIDTIVDIKPLQSTNVPKIVSRPKVVSPIDELGLTNLIDFRRIDTDTKVCIAKILSKVELLGKESFVKTIEGIAALQNSPLNRLYLAVAQKSLLEGKSPSDIISRDNNVDDITITEFNAILFLNRKLSLLL